MFVSVALPKKLNRNFTYSVPEPMCDAIDVGKRVLVPFKNRTLVGVIVKRSESCAISNVKDILDVIDERPILSPGICELSAWVSEYYVCPLGLVFSSVIPLGREIIGSREVRLRVREVKLSDFIHAPVQTKILKVLLERPRLKLSILAREIGQRALYSSLNALSRKGLIEVRDPQPNLKRSPKGVMLYRLKHPAEVYTPDFMRDLPEKQRLIIEALLSEGRGLRASEIQKIAGVSASPIKSLITRSLIECVNHPFVFDPALGIDLDSERPKELNEEQKRVLEGISQNIRKRPFSVSLLHGVTGSGKTEIYLRLIEDVVREGGGAIVLVPEISLTFQTIARFSGCFPGKIAVLHSRLTNRERESEWKRIFEGEARVVIGPRSAVFAPVRNLQLLIVDEEHDPSYKQTNNPKYNARDVAVMRAKIEGAHVVLGSATPSLESFYNSNIGKYTYFELSHRVDNRPLPRVEIVDMRQEVHLCKTVKVFSLRLQEEIAIRLDRGEQIILFLNRRGFAAFLLCEECGFSFECPRCNITLTYHKVSRRLLCHYCAYTLSAPSICPKCKGVKLSYMGMGTQRVEEEVHRCFPRARLSRLDLDVSRRRGVAQSVLQSFRRGEVDILIGTQMVSKGLDFPRVTLVGVVMADNSLSLPDFRSAERTFSLLTQVAGRSGRGKEGGLVIIQTYSPNHFSIKTAMDHDYRIFSHKELQYRQQLFYPPFSHLIRFLVVGPSETRVKDSAKTLAQRLTEFGSDPSFQVLGPAPCPISKIRGEYRWQILLKGKHRGRLKETTEWCIHHFSFKGVRVDVDVDPLSLL